MTDRPDSPERVVNAAYAALDADDAATAFELAEDALAAGGETDPEVHVLAAAALLALDRPDEAVEWLRRAIGLDPDDAECRAHLAEALFRRCDFADAEAEARRAISSADDAPLAHHVLGLVLERRDEFVEADDEFDRAVALDPDAFLPPTRLSSEAFDRHLSEAIDRVPDEFAQHLDDVAILVEALPPDDLLREEDPPLDPELLGLFVGIALTEQTTLSSGELPARVYLFQRNLERFAESPEDLVEQIAITLGHELGHYLGLDEDAIEAAGYG